MSEPTKKEKLWSFQLQSVIEKVGTALGADGAAVWTGIARG
jgi:hypothetical protein